MRRRTPKEEMVGWCWEGYEKCLVCPERM